MIYILEDDTNIRDLVVYALERQNMPIEGFGSPSVFWKAMKEHIPELILLDIMLPAEDGLSVLEKLRADDRTHAVPVIILTAKSTEFDRVLGLDHGADDFISEPFGMMELLARIRAVLRRSEKEPCRESHQIGDLYLSTQKHMVTVCGEEITLTYKEFELLTLLMVNQGSVMTRDLLLQHVWGSGCARETRTLDVHIRTLRSKMGKAGDMIRTIRGVGYKLEA